jgi:hypothetical protein
MSEMSGIKWDPKANFQKLRNKNVIKPKIGDPPGGFDWNALIPQTKI